MAAAPNHLFDASRAASPELALVDATLAAELRLMLRLPSEIDVRPQPPARDVAPMQSGLADDLIVEPVQPIVRAVRAAPETVAPDAISADELIVFPNEPPLVLPVSVGVADAVPPPASVDASGGDEESPDARSNYPVLPALDARTTDETDAALRRIREQIATVEPPTRRRRVRRSFTVASGLTAACAVAVVVTEIQLGLVNGL